MNDEVPAMLEVLRGLRKDGKFRFVNREGKRWEELEDARNALVALGLNATEPDQSKRGEDPPDCVCIVDGKRWGIEVTEIVHEPMLKERIKGSLRHHEYTDDEIVAALDEAISRKDRAQPKGEPFDRYLLVIRTEEMHMEKPRMEQILERYSAHCSLITDACLAYSYYPQIAGNNAHPYPALRINIIKA